MPHATLILFAVVATAFLIVPGHGKRLVLSYALAHGRKIAFATVPGTTLGAMIVVAATLAVCWAILSLSTMAFSILQWTGFFFLFLVCLGLARAPVGTEPVADNDNVPEEKPLRVIVRCVDTEIRDPRGSLVIAALLPQFLSPASAFLPQALTLGSIFLVLSTLSCLTYALFADRVRKTIRKHVVRRTVNRSGGTVLIAAKAVTAGYRKIAA
jgi:threonine/homoserine/homoserine lactone efflux protein